MSAVRALFLARYRDLVGTDEVELRVDAPLPVREFVALVRARGEAFSRLPAAATVAVNHEVAGPYTFVGPGDEVAFLPPVSGG
ncbi:MAG: MoaD/ThiS family protein [Gemmatimonadota bacterium]